MVETIDKNGTETEDGKLIRRADVKVAPDVKRMAEMEVARLDAGAGRKVYLYHLAEPALERFINDVTSKLPNGCGPEAIATATGGHHSGFAVPVRYRKLFQGILEFLENKKPPKTPEERQLREIMLQMIYQAGRVKLEK